MQWPLLPSFLACVFFMLVGVVITHCVEHDEVVGVVYNLFLYTAFLYPCTTQLVRQNQVGNGRYSGRGVCTTQLMQQNGRGEEGAKKNTRRGRCKSSGTNQAGHGQYSGHGVCTPKRNYLVRTNHLGVDSVAGVRRVKPAVDVITTPLLNESHTTAALSAKRVSSESHTQFALIGDVATQFVDHDEVVGQVFQVCNFVLYTAFRCSCMTHEHTVRGVCASRRNHLTRANYLGVESVVGLRRCELAVDVGAIPPRTETHTAAALFGKRFSSDMEGDGPGKSKSSSSLLPVMLLLLLPLVPVSLLLLFQYTFIISSLHPHYTFTTPSHIHKHTHTHIHTHAHMHTHIHTHTHTEGNFPSFSVSSSSAKASSSSSTGTTQPAILMNGANHYWAMVSKSGRPLHTRQWLETQPMSCSFCWTTVERNVLNHQAFLTHSLCVNLTS